jgi:prepilin-type processing-associated H-X9-DG protein
MQISTSPFADQEQLTLARGPDSRISLTPQQKKIVERGWVKDRAYVLYADGSVEVETRLGRRIFSSLQDAQEFIA